ncbi:hypothetical protein NF681_11280 [Comamonadaceae bacterium OTU4NAUVB1]|nr:hypothetical protein NF681_11280 [Comamonadaceae bacterium OTU4NAUVB1]
MNAGYHPLHVLDISEEEVSEEEKDVIAGNNHVCGALVIAFIGMVVAAALGVLL